LSEIPGLGKLKKPLRIDVEEEDGGYLIHAEDLDITESGTTFVEALAAFSDFFREDAAYWKLVDDSTLTEEAKAPGCLDNLDAQSG
jgi:inosine/xanthosine triphosphate pyrophosphatase family protein